MREMVLRLAHEIRNPLATINSSVQLIKRLGLRAEDAAVYLDDVVVEVARIDSTVRSMERFFGLDRCAPQVVEIGPAVAEALATRQEAAGKAGVRLEITHGAPDHLSVRIDPGHLGLALGELIDNAVRHGGTGATVWVEWGQAGPGRVFLRVDDEGSGVADEHAERIFRPFFSTSTQGNGLGLNVVQRICRLAGGSLGWENRDGGGCRFTMTLREGG
jgi:signal transduction histidine kinase